MKIHTFNCTKKFLLPLYIVLSITLTACAGMPEQARTDTLHGLFDKEWDYRESQNPMANRDQEGWEPGFMDLSEEAISKRAAFYDELDRELNALNTEGLNENDLVNLRIFRDYVNNQRSNYRYKTYQVPFNSDYGFYTYFPRAYRGFQFKNEADYRLYLSYLSKWPAHVEQHISHMRRGLASGMTQPRHITVIAQEAVARIGNQSVTESDFYQPFKRLPENLSNELQQNLKTEAEQIIKTQVLDSYQKLARFFKEEYIPKTRETITAADMTDGVDFYADRVKHFTTLDISPEEVHQIGLDEVARIRAEMQAIIDGLEFDGSFADFLKFLREDPRFYAKTAEELLAHASVIAKKMDGQLPKLFKTLPRRPYTVAPVPDSIAANYTTGRYVPPASDTEPGTYWVNTSKLSSRPLYTLEALTLHEAVPGHHLQIALNAELGEQPQFRQSLYINAFGEGWGLYAEWLGLETGFYQDPYSNFGRLTYEMWRAARLVIDTGVHAKGWSRDQAIQFMAENTALSLHNVKTEIDRYISWPGQALSYKMGEIIIRKLRREAEQELGDKFDVREFHEAVLSNGSVPLSVLESQVRDYIQSTGQE